MIYREGDEFMEERILVVDDEKSIADLITYAFKREGYNVETAYNGEEALYKIKKFNPHILIVDVMMPKINGFEVCRKLDNREKLGIVMLTAKSDIVDKVLGLELGADDYITKPFDIREVIARVKSLVRRLNKNTNESQDTHIQIKDLKVMLKQRKVLIKEEKLELTPKEFDLLALLLTHLERVYTREELLDLIWGMEYIGGTRTVDIHIQRLRKKLNKPYENIIQTVYRVGYKALGEIYED
ncbi:response regulator transcription factor [Clostridium botulinum]|uniref:response regulator transcription factor n=2 Tax=Clostridiaceae TaxID=31979 RepID=UPI0028776E77|nr:response regulator transcription factor [Clostridium botulinum]